MWNPEATIKRRGLDPSDTRKVIRSLNENWIITFPQGTTRPFAPGRKGTALIIKATKPVVIPVVINGFSTAFDKTGLKMRKKGVKLTVQFKAPLELDFDMSTDDMLEVIMDSIEQSKKFMPVTDQDNAPTT